MKGLESSRWDEERKAKLPGTQQWKLSRHRGYRCSLGYFGAYRQAITLVPRMRVRLHCRGPVKEALVHFGGLECCCLAPFREDPQSPTNGAYPGCLHVANFAAALRSISRDQPRILSNSRGVKVYL